MSVRGFELLIFLIVTAECGVFYWTPFPYSYLPFIIMFATFMGMMKRHRKYVIVATLNVLKDGIEDETKKKVGLDATEAS